MKNLGILAFVLLGFTFFISSCCNPCNDPALLKPSATGPCDTHIQWEMATAVAHSNGTMTSSISIIPDPNIPLNQTLTDSTTTTVFISATDTLCGIKCIHVMGGFGYTCTAPGGIGLAIDGKIKDQHECSPMTTCAFRRMRVDISNLESYLRGCQPPRVFATGGIGITAIVENTMGQKDTSMLTVQFH
jgi:hypothetical protein